MKLKSAMVGAVLCVGGVTMASLAQADEGANVLQSPQTIYGDTEDQRDDRQHDSALDQKESGEEGYSRARMNDEERRNEDSERTMFDTDDLRTDSQAEATSSDALEDR